MPPTKKTCLTCTKEEEEEIDWEAMRKEANDTKAIHIFTDGSFMKDRLKGKHAAVGVYCMNNNESSSGLIKWKGVESVRKELSNNLAEIMAVLEALKYAETEISISGLKKLIIYTDS